MGNKELAQAILDITGPRKNVRQASHCMTRLRLQLEDQEVDREALAKLPGVMGVNVAGPELQIILGPGKAAQVTEAFQTLLREDAEAQQQAGEKAPAGQTVLQGFAGKVGEGEALHQAIRKRNATPGKLFLKRISGIFVPLIPGFIGCGLLTGILNMVRRLDPALASHAFFQILGLAGSTVFWGMNLFVGWNAAKEFGGSPVLGGALGALISHPGLAEVSLYGQPLIPGRGGVVAVLLVAALGALLERKLREIIPEALDLFLTPFLVLGIMAFATLFFFQPLGGWLAEGIGFAATGAVAQGGALTGALLGGGFLPLVMLGIHQGLTPIHAQLIAQYGYTILLPILAMAGGGQVGAALAVYLKTRDPQVKKVVASALPAGLLGVGEPLIYGVTLPLGRPFLGACIGGAAGGAVQAAFQVGAGALGISGLPLAPSTTNVPVYLAGLLVSYAVGFAATWVIGFEDKSAE